MYLEYIKIQERSQNISIVIPKKKILDYIRLSR